jgi:hypothetical protein
MKAVAAASLGTPSAMFEQPSNSRRHTSLRNKRLACAPPFGQRPTGDPVAKQKRKVFHSSLTKIEWVVTEGKNPPRHEEATSSVTTIDSSLFRARHCVAKSSAL